MSEKIDFKMLVTETRPRVYLLWALLTGVGYTTTHFYQDPKINAVWTILATIGFVYMYRVMPLKVPLMKRIYIAWLVPIVYGMIISVIAGRTSWLGLGFVGYLGAFWLLISSVAFAWNGYVDPPSKWYYIAAGLNLAAGALCLFSDAFLDYQYLVAAAVSVVSMLGLWLFRSDAS